MTHDCSATALFAILDVKSGQVICDCMPRHRVRKRLKVLRNIDMAVPAQRDVHLVSDNYAPHKTPGLGSRARDMRAVDMGTAA